MNFIVVNIIVLVIVGFLTNGCSHANVQKKCSQAKERPEYICDSMWFWE